jgi:hypothetical protein
VNTRIVSCNSEDVEVVKPPLNRHPVRIFKALNKGG